MAITRRPNATIQEKFVISYDHAQVTATTTWKIMVAERAAIIDKCEYINVTGLAADGTNQFALTVQNGATVVASGVGNVSPDAIAANTFETFTLSAVAGALNLAAGDVLSLVATEAATATLPAGRVVIHGRYL